MLKERYPQAIKMRLIMDNPNTHRIASHYDTSPPQEAQRLKIHHTPKDGSWLNIAEIELNALNGQCLHRRLPDIESMRREISGWQNHRNTRGAPINWRFTTQDARIKLLRLYPQLQMLLRTKNRSPCRNPLPRPRTNQVSQASSSAPPPQNARHGRRGSW